MKSVSLHGSRTRTLNISPDGVRRIAQAAGMAPVVMRALLLVESDAAIPKLPPARFGEYSEPWRAGRHSSEIVSDDPDVHPDTMLDRDAAADYGGQLIAESMWRRHRDRAIACVNFCAGQKVPPPTAAGDGVGALGDLVDALYVTYQCAMFTNHDRIRDPRDPERYLTESEVLDRIELAQLILRWFRRNA